MNTNQPFDSDLTEAFRQARQGNNDALGRLLERHQDYVKLLARLQSDRLLQGKLDASDLVQETLMQALREIAIFRGQTEREFTAWFGPLWPFEPPRQFADMYQPNNETSDWSEPQQALDESSAAIGERSSRRGPPLVSRRRMARTRPSSPPRCGTADGISRGDHLAPPGRPFDQRNRPAVETH